MSGSPHERDVVDLLDTERGRALARAEVDGCLLTGWVDARLVRRGVHESGFSHGRWRGGPAHAGFGGWWRRCRGASRLRANAPLATGAKHQEGVRQLPPIPAEVDVMLIGADADERLISIEHPWPGVDAVILWVAAADLSTDCPP